VSIRARSKAVPIQEERAALRDFQVFITDDRYSVPTLHIVQAASAEAALELARRLVAENLHHLGAEVCDEGIVISSIGVVRTSRKPGDTSSPVGSGLKPAT
jgi:hypothetical protein